MSPAKFHYLLCAAICILGRLQSSTAVDTITPALTLKDGETIVSAKEHFELGFFSPGNSTNRYLGIWYKKIQPVTVAWVANRDNPVTNSSGVVKISDDGNLIISKSASIIWSSNVSRVGRPIAQLLDTGNLVVKEEGDDDPENYLWQSFDCPTDTMLPGMKFGWNLKKGVERRYTSWRSSDDPSTGAYSYRVDLHGLPQGFLYDGKTPIIRTGYWNGRQLGGFELLNRSGSYFYTWNFVFNRDEIYYQYVLKNESIYSRLVTEQRGVVQRYNWLEDRQRWIAYWYFPDDQCDPYNICGAYAYCQVTVSPICNCLKGFTPNNTQRWYLNDWSDGCVNRSEFECQKNDGFLKFKEMKIPDTSRAFYDENMSLKECASECRKNCSCKAYSNLYTTNGGTGCIMWLHHLIDMKQFSAGGYDLYVRMAASEIGESDSEKKRRVMLIIIFTVIPTTLLLAVFLIWKKKKIVSSMQMNAMKSREVDVKEKYQESTLSPTAVTPRGYTVEKKDDLELTLFDLATIATATENFSEVNILGAGGFGSVYKGTLGDGQEIAVKRLSKNSGQGVDEFKTELMLIAKLQHRNLVRLLGSCIEGEERMLVYEYMPNKSLDSFLFNKEKNSISLDWSVRYSIIGGIARGLLYLHQDSRFRIIHRDLKLSNILLDGEMTPKISDFGISRLFGSDDETEGKTRRVVGTYGYMSPEYAMAGLFSVKSDVFSFGVLVLEIISGKKNKGVFGSSNEDNLLGYAWTLWTEGNSLELVDESMEVSYSSIEVLKCIQIGLLCVQEQAKDRPNMSTVIAMLVSETTTTLPEPKKPGFCLLDDSPGSGLASAKEDTVNQITVTLVGR